MSVNQISGVIREIRECVNNPWKQRNLLANRKNWHMICASMDVIEDSQLAINDFYRLPRFTANSGGYLYLYGLLQAFFVQQDAVSNLNQSLFNRGIDWKKSFPDIYSIRELRNDAIGHPTNRGDKSFHFISRISINETSFEIVSYHGDSNYKFDKKCVNLNFLRTIQTQIIGQILSAVKETLQSEWTEYKQKFNGMNLMSLIPENFAYSLSKVYEGYTSNNALAELCFNELITCYTEIKDGIIERYGSIDALHSVEHITDKLDYIILRLQGWISDENLHNNKDAEIFLDGFKYSFDELKELLIEIDKEFCNID